MDYDKLFELRNQRTGDFRTLTAVDITEIADGFARGRITVTKQHLNPIGTVHGGCIFTLADEVAGTAAMSHGSYVTTISSDLNFINAGVDTKAVEAVAREKKAGKRIMVYSVDVYDDRQTLLATGTFSYYYLNQQIEQD